MLQELTHHIPNRSTSWWASDHLGTVGAALCWRHRKGSASSASVHANRLEQTSNAQWQKQLCDLDQYGFMILGYHTKPSIYCARRVIKNG